MKTQNIIGRIVYYSEDTLYRVRGILDDYDELLLEKCDKFGKALGGQLIHASFPELRFDPPRDENQPIV